jgi:hypothetical protein
MPEKMKKPNPFTQYSLPGLRPAQPARNREEWVTTTALGEEGGNCGDGIVTSYALGEEGGNGWDPVITTQALGEESGSGLTPTPTPGRHEPLRGRMPGRSRMASPLNPFAPIAPQRVATTPLERAGWPADTPGGTMAALSPMTAQTTWPAAPLT